MIHAHEHERELSELGYPVCHDEPITDEEMQDSMWVCAFNTFSRLETLRREAHYRRAMYGE